MLIRKLLLILSLLLAQPVANADGFAYKSITLQGWKVYYQSSLATETRTKLLRALGLLDRCLKQIKTIVPKSARFKLQRIPIWLSKNNDAGLVYHASPIWLAEHGRYPAMAGGVEIQNIDDWFVWLKDQPLVLLHELSHGLHHQAFNYNNPLISQAFIHAQQLGLYQRVKRYNGEMVRAYALENEREYFAELTEAYFGHNDYFPFNREQLRAYDPYGYQVVRTIWHQHY